MIYNLGFGYITEGLKAFCDENECYWAVSDMLVVVQSKKFDEFMSVHVDVADGKAQTTITDGNGKTYYTQKYELTDLTKSFKMFVCLNEMNRYTAMLPEEY